MEINQDNLNNSPSPRRRGVRMGRKTFLGIAAGGTMMGGLLGGAALASAASSTPSPSASSSTSSTTAAADATEGSSTSRCTDRADPVVASETEQTIAPDRELFRDAFRNWG